MRRCLVFTALSWATTFGAVAQDDRAALKVLNEQRANIEAQFKAESEVCTRRFFVNACMDESKERRNTGLKPLLEREALIEANERRARADAQRERVAGREREFAEAQGRQLTAELLVPVAATTASKAPLAKIKVDSAPKPSAQSLEAAQQAKAAQALDAAQRRLEQRASFQSEQEARQKAAVRHQQAQAEKLKGKKQPMALPIPSAAEIESAASAPPPLKR